MITLLARSIAVVVILIVIVEFSKERKKTVCKVTSLIYFAAVVYFVGFRGGRAGLGGLSIRFPMPFWRAIQNHHYGPTTNRSVLNIIMFIPFGYLMPQLISYLKPNWKLQWWKIVLAGFLSSLLIETTQLVFHCGVFELDDLVKNTLGAGMGWGIWDILDGK